MSNKLGIMLFFYSFFKLPSVVGEEDYKVYKGGSCVCVCVGGGGDKEREKINCVNWETMCKLKAHGGLGIKDTFIFNEALLAKWRWALFHSKGALWEKFFRSKYGGWIGLLEEFPNSLMSIWWKDLRSIYGDEEESKWFDNMIQWKDSEGNITRFWFDAWLQGQSLVTIYGRIFSNSTQKDDCIGNIGSCEDVVCIW